MYGFKRVQARGVSADNELLKIWVARYLPDLGVISPHVRKHVEQRLKSAISDASRTATAKKLDHYLASDCTLAVASTQQLMRDIGIKIDTWQLQSLSVQIYSIYEALVSGYQESFIFSPVVDYLHTIEFEASQLEAATLVIPKFESLLLSITPMLRELKATYFSSINQHLVGFMTTIVHFAQQHILSHLSTDEIVWLKPYLQLLDELLCMPWQRIYTVAAAVKYPTDTVDLVKRMLPKVNSISSLTYQRLLQKFPNHISCQGRLQSLPVQHSSLRDLSMFQAYIWLSVLENSSSIIEKNLLPLCLQVFPLTKVEWELVTFAVGDITDNIQDQLTPAEQAIFGIHAEKVNALFLDSQPEPNRAFRLK